MKVLKKRSLLVVGRVSLLAVLVFAFALPNTTSAKVESTSPFIFSQISNAECKASLADKTMTEAIIPSSHNGLTVTALAANGFATCANLETVFIPHSVKKIGLMFLHFVQV